MTIQKFVTYNSLDIDGEVLEDKHELTFTVLEKSGNQLIHKDILRHQLHKNKVLSLLKQEVKFEVVVVNRGDKKEQAVLEQVQIVHRYGKVVGLFLGQNLRKVILKLNKKET